MELRVVFRFLGGKVFGLSSSGEFGTDVFAFLKIAVSTLFLSNNCSLELASKFLSTTMQFLSTNLASVSSAAVALSLAGNWGLPNCSSKDLDRKALK